MSEVKYLHLLLTSGILLSQHREVDGELQVMVHGHYFRVGDPAAFLKEYEASPNLYQEATTERFRYSPISLHWRYAKASQHPALELISIIGVEMPERATPKGYLLQRVLYTNPGAPRASLFSSRAFSSMRGARKAESEILVPLQDCQKAEFAWSDRAQLEDVINHYLVRTPPPPVVRVQGKALNEITPEDAARFSPEDLVRGLRAYYEENREKSHG